MDKQWTTTGRKRWERRCSEENGSVSAERWWSQVGLTIQEASLVVVVLLSTFFIVTLCRAARDPAHDREALVEMLSLAG